MKRNISIIQRFLLPVAVLIIISAAILAERETAQQMRSIEKQAHRETQALLRLLDVTESLVNDRVYSSISMLRMQGKLIGQPSIRGKTFVGEREVPNLVLGKTPQTYNFQLVDSISEHFGGTATLFVKSGNDFVRVSTNLRKSDGERAVGTVLDPEGKALAALRQGETFYGVVDILGEPYITGYEPMRNNKGEIIGAWYVGYKADLEVLRQAVQKTRYLKNGFLALQDYRGQIRFLSDHISMKDAEHLLAQKPRGWVISSEEIPQWGYRAVIAYPKSEARLSGLSNSLYLILIGTLLGIALIAIIITQLRRLILRPLGGDPAVAVELVHRTSMGDLSNDENVQADIGTLMADILTMRHNLRVMVNTLEKNAERLTLSASVFEYAHEGIFIMDPQRRIVDVNPAFSELTGYSREDAFERTPQQLGFFYQEPDFFDRLWNGEQRNDEWRGEAWNKRKDGDTYIARLDLFAVRSMSQEISHYVGICSDMTLLKEQQQRLERMAYHDPLTQLPNRTLFFDSLKQALARTRRKDELLAVCYLDLDNFKPVNDSMGHKAGDQLLIQMAERIRSSLRAHDIVARLGGDEFALLLSGLESPAEVEHTLARLLTSISAPYELNGRTIMVAASIGYTIYPEDDVELDELLQHADKAMYRSKLNGGNNYHRYDAMDDNLVRMVKDA
ncbi:MAG TPA: diguanylate cyclase [Methylophilaceae bacterium]|nr:diguanylate cyclase [Methylophilaceae bacterium]